MEVFFIVGNKYHSVPILLRFFSSKKLILNFFQKPFQCLQENQMIFFFFLLLFILEVINYRFSGS